MYHLSMCFPFSTPTGLLYQPGLNHEDKCYAVLSCSAVSDYLRPHGLQPAVILCPWDSPGKKRVGSHALFQGIFLILGSNLCLLRLLHGQEGSSPLEPPGKLQVEVEWALNPIDWCLCNKWRRWPCEDGGRLDYGCMYKPKCQGCQQPLKAKKGREGFFHTDFRRNKALLTPWSLTSRTVKQ